MAENKWIRVEDRLPTMRLVRGEEGESDYFNSDFVLVVGDRESFTRVVVAHAEINIRGLCWVTEGGSFLKSDFWMPLPPPPVGGA